MFSFSAISCFTLYSSALDLASSASNFFTANSVVGEYNPNATPANKFLVLCKGDTAPTEVSVLVELDLI